MTRNETDRLEESTRRDYLKYGSAVVGTGLLAGCVENGSDNEADPGDQRGSYSATLSPAGTVTFDEPPETIYTDLTHHAGMALALGRGDAVNATWGGERFGPVWNNYLERLEGISVEWSDLPDSLDADKELFYELDSDLHLADPAYVTWMDGMDSDDVAEINRTVAPFFGNTFSNGNTVPPEEWDGEYRHYTLWEIFDRVAAVFQERDRYDALAEIHSSVLEAIDTNRPPAAQRPSVAVVQFLGDSIWAYPLNADGFMHSHIRPLEAKDAFGGELDGSTEVDLELLVDRDPDVLLVTETMGEDGIEDARRTLADDPVGSELTAVKDDRIYAGGVRNQGPILNLFQLEMTAKQLYPEQFGAWPRYEDGDSYPEFTVDEQLFDRQRVADIINGER